MVFQPLYQQLAVIVLFLREVWHATLGVAFGIVSFLQAVPSFMKPEHLFSPSLSFFTRSPHCYDSIVSFLNASSLLVPEEWWVAFTLRSAYGGHNLLLVLTFFYCFMYPVPTNKFFLPLVCNLKLHSCEFAFSFPLQRRPLSCKMFGL